MAHAKNIPLADGLHPVAMELVKTNSLIGSALRLLTDNAENQATLKTSLGTLTRVLNEVSWSRIGKGNSDAWLYFYEDFLEVDWKTTRDLSSISTRCSPPVNSSVFGGEVLVHKAPLASAHATRDSASRSARISRPSSELSSSIARISRMQESTSAGWNPSVAWS